MMLFYVPGYLRAFVLQDPQEMEWIHGMQDPFFVIFLAGLGFWVIAEYFRTFWKRNTDDVIPENEANIHML